MVAAEAEAEAAEALAEAAEEAAEEALEEAVEEASGEAAEVSEAAEEAAAAALAEAAEVSEAADVDASRRPTERESGLGPRPVPRLSPAPTLALCSLLFPVSRRSPTRVSCLFASLFSPFLPAPPASSLSAGRSVLFALLLPHLRTCCDPIWNLGKRGEMGEVGETGDGMGEKNEEGGGRK